MDTILAPSTPMKASCKAQPSATHPGEMIGWTVPVKPQKPRKNASVICITDHFYRLSQGEEAIVVEHPKSDPNWVKVSTRKGVGWVERCRLVPIDAPLPNIYRYII